MDAGITTKTIRVRSKTVPGQRHLGRGNPDSGKIERVRLQDITTTALLSVEGELDDISGSGQHGRCDICSGVPRSMQPALEVQGAGASFVAVGEMVYPTVKNFIWPTIAPTRHKGKIGSSPVKSSNNATKSVANKRATRTRA